MNFHKRRGLWLPSHELDLFPGRASGLCTITNLPMDTGVLSLGKSVALATFIVRTIDPANLTNYTFSSQTLTASMVVAINRVGGATQGISSVTVGGVTATAGVTQVNADGEVLSAIYYVSGVTPGTGDIVVNGSAASVRCSIATYESTGAAATPTSTDGDTWAATGSPPSMTVNVPANGFAIGTAISVNEAVTWTSVGVDEDYDELVELPDTYHTGGHKNYAAIQTGLTVRFDPSSSLINKGCETAISFGPA